MANFTAADVKRLREQTGAGMMDCKKALAENGGDMEKSIDWLRTKGLAAAAKKAAAGNSPFPPRPPASAPDPLAPARRFSGLAAKPPSRQESAKILLWVLLAPVNRQDSGAIG